MKRWLPFLVSLAALGLALAVQVSAPGPSAKLRHVAFDTYQRLLPREYEPLPVRIVDIDETSLEKLGQWPWPRTLIAELVQTLGAAGVAAIAFDMVFAEPDRSTPGRALSAWRDRPEIEALLRTLPDNDETLAQALADSPVVLGFILNGDAASARSPTLKAGFAVAGADPRPVLADLPGAVAPLEVLEAAAVGAGALNYFPDGDGKVRRVPLVLRHGEQLVPSLVAEAIRVAGGGRGYAIKTLARARRWGTAIDGGITAIRIGRATVPTTSRGEVWLHYTPPEPARTTPAWRLMGGGAAAETFRDSIVFVGTSALGLGDQRFNALGNPIPGVEIHAQLAEQILARAYLTRPSWARPAEITVQALGALVLVLLVVRLGALWSAVACGAVILGGFGGSIYAFAGFGLLLDPLTPAATFVLVYLAASVTRHAQMERQQRFIRKAFSSYVSPNLVRHLIEHPEALKLGGERRECSFVFTDLADFTPMVERSDPADLVSLLNEYLEAMTAIAFRHDGTLDNIVGDAIAVMFSAPVAQPDHAARAVACAADMDAFAVAFTAAKRAQHIPLGHTRIGVHSGPVIVGNVGGKIQFDYRAFGDAINTASRLESANKHLGTRVCVSNAAAAACPGFRGRPVGSLVLKGKTAAIEAFEPIALEDAESPRIAAYRAAYRLMADNDPSALAAFEALVGDWPKDTLAALHLRRLKDGATGATIVMTEK